MSDVKSKPAAKKKDEGPDNTPEKPLEGTPFDFGVVNTPVGVANPALEPGADKPGKEDHDTTPLEATDPGEFRLGVE